MTRVIVENVNSYTGESELPLHMKLDRGYRVLSILGYSGYKLKYKV